MQNCCIIALLFHTISALSNIPVLASFLRVVFFFFSGYVHVQRFSSHAITYIWVLSFDLWTNKCTLHFQNLLCQLNHDGQTMFDWYGQGATKAPHWLLSANDSVVCHAHSWLGYSSWFSCSALDLNWNASPFFTANEMFISIIGAVFLDPQVRSIVRATYDESEYTFECLHDCVSWLTTTVVSRYWSGKLFNCSACQDVKYLFSRGC